ncbi:hypothetical protein SO802_005162 [Lithocarpus litseifolius]|uniref:Uncharacterized protein n=1 Tax=Lithocarpus litseifolius TaxID=425828 RepID=A0AAW2DIX9_9ROSI
MTSNEVVVDLICSDESVESFKGSEHMFDCDEALQWELRMILQEHSDNISLPPCEAIDVLGEQNQLAVVSTTTSNSMVRTTMLGEGDEVIVQDWVSDTCSEDVPQSNENYLSPLSVEPMAFSMPSDFCAGQKEVSVDSSRGQELYLECFQSRFNEFGDFLGTSLNGLEE